MIVIKSIPWNSCHVYIKIEEHQNRKSDEREIFSRLEGVHSVGRGKGSLYLGGQGRHRWSRGCYGCYGCYATCLISL
jgi:hypothetical protein